jgi:polyisoprenoid-binding protein YceI
MKRIALVALVFLLGARANADAPAYAVDPAGSTLTFKAYKEGWFSSLGHDHTIAGREFAGAVRFDPARVEASSVTLTVKTASLDVLDPSADASDKAKIAKTLKGGEVLDVEKFPEIRFASSAVSIAERQPGGRLKVAVKGDLTLHGVTRAVEFAAFVEPPAGSGPLKATGTIGLDGSGFGIEPYGVGLGAVKVKDHVELEFSIVARQPHGEEAR